jgi:hypothetical protein
MFIAQRDLRSGFLLLPCDWSGFGQLLTVAPATPWPGSWRNTTESGTDGKDSDTMAHNFAGKRPGHVRQRTVRRPVD